MPTPPSAPAPRRARWPAITGITLALLLLIIGAGEWLGWPWLARPVAQALSQRLDRPLAFDADGQATTLRVRFLGGLHLQARRLQIGGPRWSTLGPTLQADEVDLALRYTDLLALRHGEPLRVKRLAAQQLLLQLERLADGRASWQFGPQPDPATPSPRRPALDGVRFDALQVVDGQAVVHDAQAQLNLQLRFALQQGSQAAVMARAASGAAPASPARPAPVVGAQTTTAPSGLSAQATGDYRGQPLQVTLSTGPADSWLSNDPEAPSVPVVLALSVGRAALDFNGSVQDLLGRQALKGRYHLRGPSMAAVGAALGLTLPTTAPFAVQGGITRSRQGSDEIWHTQVDRAIVGQSHLTGDFRFTRAAGQPPRLDGQLAGPVLQLADLGPAVGVPAPAAPTASPAPSAAPGPRRVLPQRTFNLPALRAMNADIDIQLDRLDLGTQQLADIRPLKARLQLADGVLTLRDIDARIAKGALAGQIRLDGRAATAHWQARLQLKDMKLEDWLQPARGPNQAPYATGRVGLTLQLDGQGRSTAELLASADGRAIVHWRDGTLSHLLTEAAGLDAAQALAVWLRGDGALPVTCAAADLDVKDGRVTPRVLLVDSRDSTLWVDGTVSLATEQLALVAHVAPKDVSPLSLRSPVHIDGTLGAPSISVEKGPLLRRLLPAALLATLSPLAAFIPLVDTGDDDAGQALKTCYQVAARRLDRAPL